MHSTTNNMAFKIKLSKLDVETFLYYARIDQMFTYVGVAKDTYWSYASNELPQHRQKSLTEAMEFCKHPFRGRYALLQAIVTSKEMPNKESYKGVLKEKLEAIKTAMVSRPGRITTHSEHWYNCVNGYSSAIGE
ncbi:hypothetical protein yc1106_01620 [Curvularia clavata]|uniref:Uncharacterized protein n=1 Tax=Curvularia clavata TaxID=95742 RepID=A0A9Q9DQI3_CURCL|nr:hypothetical protein yc1106_01620 [Curvularia clavata]